jgi:hypothetical protein
MKQRLKYLAVDTLAGQQNYLRSSAIQKAGGFLAVSWLSFGAVTAGFDSPSLQERMATFLLCGLMPAAVVYGWGHILSKLLTFSGKTPEINVTLRFLQKLWCSVHHNYWRTHAIITQFSCLVIRSAAQFILSVQSSGYKSRVPCF